MALRWQGVGERSHAVDTDHTLRTFERFRALCGHWCEVGPPDLHTRHGGQASESHGFTDRGRLPACTECDAVWSDMNELEYKQKAGPA